MKVLENIYGQILTQIGGVLKIALEDNFSFSKYKLCTVSANVFIVRDNNYLNCAGKSFRVYDVRCNSEEKPTIADWENHLSTIFTEVRLKRLLK